MPLFIIIPGVVVTVVTFPGVIVHEAAHLLFCRLRKVAVFDVCFFQVENPAGYVIHEPTDNFRTAFAVGLGPFLVNSVLCVLFCSAAILPIWELRVETGLPWLFAWLGISIGMHAFPSQQDIANVRDLRAIASADGDLLAKLSAPILLLLRLADVGRVVWVDALYAVAIGVLLPLAVFKAMI